MDKTFQGNGFKVRGKGADIMGYPVFFYSFALHIAIGFNIIAIQLK